MLALALGAFSSCEELRWSLAAAGGDGYTARDGHDYFTWGDQLCSIGGRGDFPVECLDTKRLIWSRKASWTYDVHHIQPVWHGSEVWMPVGITGPWPVETQISQSLVYNPSGDSIRYDCWIPPEHRREADFGGRERVVSYGDSIVVVNGAKDGFLAYMGASPYFGVSRLRPATCTWDSPYPTPNFARDHFSAALVGSRLVILAGRISPSATSAEVAQSSIAIIKYEVAQTEWIDLAAHSPTWHLGASIPTTRSGYSILVDQAEALVCVLGGENADPSGADPVDLNICRNNPSSIPVPASKVVECYDVYADTWMQGLPPMEKGRQGAVAMIASEPNGEQRLIVAGGSVCGGSGPLITSVEWIKKPWRMGNPGDAPCPPPPPISCEDVTNVLAGDYTCGGRINYLISFQGFSLSDARQAVADQFPNDMENQSPLSIQTSFTSDVCQCKAAS
ncbi:MAG: hypothetical protein SGPRY_009556 [Prymnesium sp.]